MAHLCLTYRNGSLCCMRRDPGSFSDDQCHLVIMPWGEHSVADLEGEELNFDSGSASNEQVSLGKSLGFCFLLCQRRKMNEFPNSIYLTGFGPTKQAAAQSQARDLPLCARSVSSWTCGCQLTDVLRVLPTKKTVGRREQQNHPTGPQHQGSR